MLELILNLGVSLPPLPDLVPGATVLSTGDENVGYYSTVSANELITPSAFCAKVGLTLGTLINPSSEWVKMSYNKRTVFYSKKCIRQGISWNTLNTLGLVDGTTFIVARGSKYKCRIMKASTVVPYTQGEISNPSQMLGTEYTHLVLRMCTATTTVESGAKLGTFTPTELGMLEGINMLTGTTSTSPSNFMSVGGATSVTQVKQVGSTASLPETGYRVVLELVDPPPTVPDSGPGPTEMVQYDPDTKAGYYGQVPFVDLFTIEEIEAIALTPLPGAATNRTSANYWFKTYLNGKVIFLPKFTVRTGTTWESIYKAGFVYGVDGPGKSPPASGAVNQMRVLTKTAQDGTVLKFKVRMIQAYGVDPYPASLLPAQTALSEYNLLRERLAPTQGNPVVWSNQGGIGGQTFGYEKNAAGTQALMLNNNGTYLYRTSWDITTNQFCQFYPVLELIEVIKP